MAVVALLDRGLQAHQPVRGFGAALALALAFGAALGMGLSGSLPSASLSLPSSSLSSPSSSRGALLTGEPIVAM